MIGLCNWLRNLGFGIGNRPDISFDVLIYQRHSGSSFLFQQQAFVKLPELINYELKFIH